MRQLVLHISAWLLLVGTAWAALPEPPVMDNPGAQTFGDARNIELLATLLTDTDPTAREMAARDLAATNNPDAIPVLRKFLADADPRVRASAVRAAGGFPPGVSGDLVTTGLNDTDETVVTTALSTVARMPLPAAAQAIDKLATESKSLAVQSASLRALTALGQAADTATLKARLASSKLAVRAAAAENALLVTNAYDLLDDLRTLARTDKTSAGGWAVAALGKFDAAGSADIIDAAARDESALVRRGAVAALRNSKAAGRIAPFLNDPSPSVRLEAIRAAGSLKCLDTRDKLLEIMLQAPPMEQPELSLHLAAREALAVVGAELTDRIASELRTNAERIAAANKALPSLNPAAPAPAAKAAPTTADAAKADAAIRQRLQLDRNALACAWLLNRLPVSRGTVEPLAYAMTSVEMDSPVISEAAEALARTGDPAATDALVAYADKLYARGLEYAVKQGNPMVPPPPFDDRGAARFVHALAQAAGQKSLPGVLRFAYMNYQRRHLSDSTAQAMIELTTLQQPAAEQEKFHAKLIEVLTDSDYGALVRYTAVRLVGRLKLAAAQDKLRKILDVDRESLAMMTAAAWSLEQITGQTPKIGKPKTMQNPEWIIHKAE